MQDGFWGSALVIGVLAQGPSAVTAPWLPVDSGHPFSVPGHLWNDAEFQLNSWQFVTWHVWSALGSHMPTWETSEQPRPRVSWREEGAVMQAGLCNCPPSPPSLPLLVVKRLWTLLWELPLHLESHAFFLP